MPDRITNSAAYKQLIHNISDIPERGKVYLKPLPGSLLSLCIKSLEKKERELVLLFENKTLLYETNVELEILGVKSPKILFDEYSESSILEKITKLTSNENFIVLATYDILKTPFPAKEDVKSASLTIEAGMELDYDEFLEYLNMYGYGSEDYVEIPGSYAMRGAIIDFWSFSEKNPARIEFNGDLIESIRFFDPDSQRSLGSAESVILSPGLDNSGNSLSATIFDYFSDPLIFASETELNNLFTKREKEFGDKDFEIIDEEIDDELKKELFDDTEKAESHIDADEAEISVFTELDELFKAEARWVIETGLASKVSPVRHSFKETPTFDSNFKLLTTFFEEYLKKGFRIIITSENELQQSRLTELFSELSEEIYFAFEDGKISVIVLPIKSGFISSEDKIILLSDYKIFGKPYRTKISSKHKRKRSRTKEFASLKKGDFVVHETFGIGRYEGLTKIKIGAVEQESLKIVYAGDDVVFVNLNFLGLVKKFSSKEGATPKLTKLGSPEWRTSKRKVKKRIKDAARDLIKLYAERKSAKGFSFSEDSVWQMELEASFFYEDTPDQSKVTGEIKSDMESASPMDRLVCGDVGFGKTEVAVRSAFKAVNDGKQVAVLVPTTILAEQHFNTFRDRLSPFPVRVEELSRFVPKKRQVEIVEDLAKGKVDIVIGTHRLISKDVKFKDLGLLIIDEEHRFGVMAKEKLRKMRTNVDTLTLTATPIPRTLNMSLLGARDLSIIATPPPNRQPIFTKVDVFDVKKIREWILKELARGGQIYFVHDRVQSIYKISSYLKKYIPEVTFRIAHGQMKPAELEKVIFDFMNKKFDMLISTKIIESGIDIPNVNTIIINRADRFGLAELHQLRGRVGRAEKQAYAYLLVPSLKTISKKAVRRLQAIEEYTDVGAGFNLSMRDLEIRGAGNLLGTEQSGAINAVGFDLFLKLLDEAINELKSDEFKEEFKELPEHINRTDTVIDTYFEIGIPKTYMPNQGDRLGFYTSLFSMVNINELEEIKEEMKDRFGRPPEMAQRMMAAAVIKFYASYLNFERVIITERKIMIVLPKGDDKLFYEVKFPPLINFVTNKLGKNFQLVQNKNSIKLELVNNFKNPEEVLSYLIRFTKELKEELIGTK